MIDWVMKWLLYLINNPFCLFSQLSLFFFFYFKFLLEVLDQNCQIKIQEDHIAYYHKWIEEYYCGVTRKTSKIKHGSVPGLDCQYWEDRHETKEEIIKIQAR